MNHEEFIRYVQSLAVPQRKLGSDHPYLLLASQLMLAVGVPATVWALMGRAIIFLMSKKVLAKIFRSGGPRSRLC